MSTSWIRCFTFSFLIAAASGAAPTFNRIVIDSSFAGDVKGIGDIDGDGFPDVVIGGRTMHWYRYPAWSKHTLATAAVEFTTDMQLVDVDRDGDLDVVTGDGSGSNNVVWLENPRPSQSPTAAWTKHVIGTHGDWAHDIEVGDLDRDGKVDVITRKTQTNIFFQNSTGSWTKRSITSFATGGEGMGLGDVDRDGDPDIVVAGRWLATPANPRTGTFTSYSISSGWPSDTTATVADMNGDGRPDVVFAAQHGRNKLAWYEGPANPATGTWIEHVLDPSMGSHKLNVGDLNRDGLPDVVAGLELSELSIYVQQPGGTFTKQTLSFQGIHNQQIGDIGNDGDLDIFGANYLDNPPVQFWENTTASTAPDTTAPSTPQNLSAAAVSTSRINLAWNASTDNVAVTGYRVYRGSTAIGTTTALSYADSSLNAGTTYTYRVTAFDAAGNQSGQSVPASATTSSVQDTTAPGISAVNSTNVTAGTAGITWTTNEAADSQVEYGVSTAYGHSTTVATALVTAHSVTVSGLSANTLYHYRVKSRDSSGNLGTSQDFTFVTTPEPQGTPGLIAQWKLDDGAGTAAIDSSGTNNGTLMNGAAWTTGRLGGGLNFDGSNDYVALPNLDVPSAGITITAWIKFSGFPSNADQRVISKASNSSEQGHYWMLSQIGNRLRFRLKTGGSTSTLIAQSGDLVVNTWYHAAAVYDGSTMRLYLNGVQVGSMAKTGAVNSNARVALNIGRSPDGSNYFAGVIDDVRIYNKGLTANEVTSVMQGN